MYREEESRSLFPQVNHLSPLRCWLAAFCILVSHLLEHYAYNTVTLNFKSFLTTEQYHWKLDNVSMVIFLLDSLSMALAVFGGLIADFVIHRLLLVIIVYVCYLFGVLGLSLLYLNAQQDSSSNIPNLCNPLTAMTNITGQNSSSTIWSADRLVDEKCAPFILTIVFLVAIGSGMARIILAVLGADQVRSLGAKAVSLYFLIYYIFWNIGDWMADGVGSFLNCNYHEFSLIILSVIVCFSSITLYATRCLYTVRRNEASFMTILEVMKQTFKHRNDGTIVESIFDRAKESMGGSCNEDQVEGLKRLRNTCILFLVLIPTFTIINIYNFYTKQGLHMRLPALTNDFPMPSSWIQSLENLGVLFVSMPIALIVIYMTAHRLGVFYVRRRVLLGMTFAAMSVLAAGILESLRLKVFWGWDNPTVKPWGKVIYQNIHNITYLAADMSVFWTIPQFVLLGSAEMFIFIPAMEYTYLSSVPWLQCTALGIIWAAEGMGTLFDGSLIFGLNNVVFNSTDINYRTPCSSVNSYLNNSSGGLLSTLRPFEISERFCWESRMDYLYYIIFIVQIFGISVSTMFIYHITPQILQSSYIALDDRLQGEDEDELTDPENSAEHFNNSLINPVT